MILLTNRVHPYGKGDVAELRRRISAAVGPRFGARRAAGRRGDGRRGGARGGRPPWPDGSTLTGLDRLVADDFAPLAGRTVGPHHQPDRHRLAGAPRMDLLARRDR